MATNWLARKDPASVTRGQQNVLNGETLEAARSIIATVRASGDHALREYISRFEARTPAKLLLKQIDLADAFERLPNDVQALLKRTAGRIESFAKAQRACVTALNTSIEGGTAGHDVAPVERAACYAPGGRFPLPSSVLMTAVTARVAGVEQVYVVTPSDEDIMLGAAFVAGADGLIQAGGAHAIAAVAYGTETIPAVDVVVGPGNRWVTAAKSIVSGDVGIDMLAGPSELLVVADGSSCPETIAADLLAQAEHDPDARPILVTEDDALIDAVNQAIDAQLAQLSTAEIARAALSNGGAFLCESDNEIVRIVNRIAPEHLELIGPKSEGLSSQIRHYGGLFIGRNAAEVLGDYGAGPNHTLPTGGTARFSGGLSVFNFLRIRTWMRIDAIDEAAAMVKDAEALANLEGLAGHARAAKCRL